MRSASLNTNSRSWLTQITALPYIAELADHLGDVRRFLDTERCGRLVQEDDRLVHADRPSDRDDSSLATGQQADRCPDVADADLPGHAARPAPRRRCGAGRGRRPTCGGGCRAPCCGRCRGTPPARGSGRPRRSRGPPLRPPIRRCGSTSPSTSTSPSSARWMPVMILMAVDLPAPLSPTIACTSPACASKETSSKRGHGAEVLLDAAQPQRGSVVHQL